MKVVLRSSKVGVVWVAVVMMGGIVGGVLAGPSTLTHHQQEQQQPQHPDTTEVSQDTHSQQQRDGKLFVILAKVPETQCVTTDSISTLGTCMPSYQCTSTGGMSKGTCVKGLAVCCLITRTCDKSTNLNNTYFVNPSAQNTNIGACTLTINRVNSNICQMRFDFIKLDLNQPDNNGVCAYDFLTVTGGVSTVPLICGSNSGQHFYYDVDPNGGPVKLTIDRSNITLLTTSWNIKITQISCDSRYRAPDGCLQYYTATAGTVSSFNFLNAKSPQPLQQGTRQLANQDYGICIKRADSYCGIVYDLDTTDGNYGFTLNGSADVIAPDLVALRARRTVFLKRLDRLITAQATEEIKSSIEAQNPWAKVEFITKIPNVSSMPKVTFSDVNMAAREMDQSETTETPTDSTNENPPALASTSVTTDQSDASPQTSQPPAKKVKTQEPWDESLRTTATPSKEVHVLPGVYFYTSNQNENAMYTPEIIQRLHNETVKFTCDSTRSFTIESLINLLSKSHRVVALEYTTRKKFRTLQNGTAEDGTYDVNFRDENCTTDYVVIPGGMYTKHANDVATSPADRYCGLGFPNTVTTTAKPFVLYFKTDGNETLDSYNRGFSLNYRQITSCT
ncbi:uncharacterized protein [Cherax quadricarinatus]